MTENIFENNVGKKKTVLILLGNRYKPSNGTSIKYMKNEDHDIYVLSNYQVYIKYVESLLKETETRDIHLLPVFNTFSELLNLLGILDKQGNPDHKNTYRNQFIDGYMHYLKSSIELDDNEDAFEVKLSQGQADRPLSYNVTLLLDTESFAQDHLSTSSISVQQILRFIGLKHSTSLIAVSGILTLIKNDEAIRNLLQIVDHGKILDNIRREQSLEQLQRPEPISIYDEAGIFSSEGVFINLLIPRGWDSWNKIELVAKSIIHDASHILKTRLLISKDDFLQLDQLYNEYFIDDATGDSYDKQRDLLDFIELKKSDIGSFTDDNFSNTNSTATSSMNTKPLTYQNLLKDVLSDTYYHT